jgi:hypothetical protein
MTQKDMFKKTTKKVSMWFFFILTALIFVFVGLYDFVSYEFKWQNLVDPIYWSIFGITICLAISVFFLAVGNSKKKHLFDIEFIINEVAKLANIIQVSLDNLFSKVIDKINSDDRKKLYEYGLKRKKDKVENSFFSRKRKDEKINAIKQELQDLADGKIDIEHKKIRGFRPISTNEVYSGYSSRSQLETENLHYSGYENMATWIIPVIIIGTLILGLALGSDFGSKAFMINMIVQTIIKLIVMLLYVWQGLDYGNYSINTVYKSVLGKRKGLMSNFLLEHNFLILPAYKQIITQDGKTIELEKEMEIQKNTSEDKNETKIQV